MDAATQMAADGLQAFGMIGTVLWTMLRIGAVAMAMPMVGTRAVPARIRVIWPVPLPSRWRRCCRRFRTGPASMLPPY